MNLNVFYGDAAIDGKPTKTWLINRHRDFYEIAIQPTYLNQDDAVKLAIASCKTNSNHDIQTICVYDQYGILIETIPVNRK